MNFQKFILDYTKANGSRIKLKYYCINILSCITETKHAKVLFWLVAFSSNHAIICFLKSIYLPCLKTMTMRVQNLHNRLRTRVGQYFNNFVWLKFYSNPSLYMGFTISIIRVTMLSKYRRLLDLYKVALNIFDQIPF